MRTHPRPTTAASSKGGPIIEITRIRAYRPLIIAAAAASLSAASGAVASAATTPAEPALRLVAASPSITLEYFGEPQVFLDLGTYLVAGRNPFEVRATRKSYHDPIVATQYLRQGGRTRTKTLPAGIVRDFSGFPGFLHVTVNNQAGQQVLVQDQTFCPSGGGARTRPDAPGTSPFPEGCSLNPFALGSVWGIQAGWSASTVDWNAGPVLLPDGEYTAKITVAAAYRNLFGIPADEATVHVTVRPYPERAVANGRSAARRGTSPSGPQPVPNGARPTGAAKVPAGPKPDLRPLPAWGVQVTTGQFPGPDGNPPPDNGKRYLAFNANVWNAGPAPLVVDGFRQAGQPLMDAYQYFYDSHGNEVGYAPTGTLQWDARDGHNHWHFTDFASYRLLDESQHEVVRSQKEAFCLAPTDAIDFTVKNANWKPSNTDLHTACGGETALSVREVLDVGSGDTYQQYLPGQSFDITDLPNGTYYIQVIANPDHRLYESSTANNTSVRKVVLGGTPSERTVTVPPYELVDAP